MLLSATSLSLKEPTRHFMYDARVSRLFSSLVDGLSVAFSANWPEPS